MKRIVPGVLVLALAGCASQTVVEQAAEPGTAQPEVVPVGDAGRKVGVPRPGEPAPDFVVVDPEGRELRLADFAGKVLILDFWATWCGPCIQAMPHNDAIYKRYSDQGVVLLAVCSNDTRESYDGWVGRNRKRYSFLTAFDPAGRDYESSFVKNAYGVTGFPTLFVIGRDGRLVGMASGGGPQENPEIERLLASAGVPVDPSRLARETEMKPATVPAGQKTPALMGMGAPKAADGRPRFGTMEIGQTVPDFAVTGEDGGDLTLSQFRGQVVLLHFFTGGRPLPYIDEIARAFREQGLAVVGICSATEKAVFDEWVKGGKSGVSYLVSWDPVGKAFMEGVSHMQFGIGMYPASVVIDREGRLVDGAIGFGAVGEAKVREALEKAGLRGPAAGEVP